MQKNAVLYQAWLNMKARCKPTFKQAKDYYERGIGYAVEWESYYTFQVDMEEGWKAGLILDRKDNDKGYTKENCRWVSRVVSQSNRRVTGLSEEQVAEVRRLRLQTDLTETEIGVRFGVSRSMIADVFRRVPNV